MLVFGGKLHRKMIIFLFLSVISIIAIITVFTIILIKYSKKSKEEKSESVRDMLDSRAFWPSEIHIVSNSFILAINKSNTKIAIIKNYNPAFLQLMHYSEIATSFIIKIEQTKFSVKIFYTSKGETKTLFISPATKEIKDFVHRIYKNALVKKVLHKYENNDFKLTASSDWNCSYIWLYDIKNGEFAYYKTEGKQIIGKINLRKEFFTIDTKYQYLEAPISGIQQQLFIYEKSFLDELLDNIKDLIKKKSSQINNDTLFFDSYNEIIYLSNGINSMQSIIIDKTEDVIYRENRLTFTLWDTQKVVNFISNKELTKNFEEFTINYNLKSIAQNFNYKTDKLINTTQNTKFIVDVSRDRLIYCANLNKFKAFSYMTIAFSNVDDINVLKSGFKNFVRIFTKEKEIIDVTCDKQEIACYIEALVKKVANLQINIE